MPARIHWPGYAKIIRLLTKKPRSWVDVCAATNLQRRESAHKILYGFVDAGMAHICGWEMDDDDARTRRPLFTWGPGQNVPFPAGPKAERPKRADGTWFRRKKAPPPSLLVMIVAIRALMDEPQQGKCLSIKTGAVRETARNIIRALHAERLIYIDHFQDRGASGAGYPFYAWGPGLPDAIKPRRQPQKVGSLKNNRNQKIRNATVNLLHAMAGSDARRTSKLAHSAEVLATA